MSPDEGYDIVNWKVDDKGKHHITGKKHLNPTSEEFKEWEKWIPSSSSATVSSSPLYVIDPNGQEIRISSNQKAGRGKRLENSHFVGIVKEKPRRMLRFERKV